MPDLNAEPINAEPQFEAAEGGAHAAPGAAAAGGTAAQRRQ
eukprot:gene992-6752_t